MTAERLTQIDELRLCQCCDPRIDSIINELLAALTWRPISTAPKNRTSFLLKVKPDISTIKGRPDLEGLNGIRFVGRHPGLGTDGFDYGWTFAAPVGYGGIPDEWLVGWMPVPE